MLDNADRSFARAAVRRGFTLIEILVVVVLLGILAAIVVPRVTTAAEQSRRNAVKATLYRVRQQLQLYKQHHGDWPSDFTRQMTRRSRATGRTPPAGEPGEVAAYPYGPYLQTRPSNPFTESRDVGNQEPGASAWYYNPETGLFKANDSDAHRAY